MLEANGDLVRIKEEIDPNLEMTEIADRTCAAEAQLCQLKTQRLRRAASPTSELKTRCTGYGRRLN